MKREIVEAATLGFELQKQRIDATIADLKAQLNGSTASTPSASASVPKAKTKRKMSAAGRKAISVATKKRWAAFYAAQGSKPKAAGKTAVNTKAAPKATAKRKMSAAGKAKLVANLRKARAAKVAKRSSGAAVPF